MGAPAAGARPAARARTGIIARRGFAAPKWVAPTLGHGRCAGLGGVPELFPVLYGQSVFYFQRGELAEAEEAQGVFAQAGRVTGHRIIGSALCQLGGSWKAATPSRRHFAATTQFGIELHPSLCHRLARDVAVVALALGPHSR